MKVVFPSSKLYILEQEFKREKSKRTYNKIINILNKNVCCARKIFPSYHLTYTDENGKVMFNSRYINNYEYYMNNSIPISSTARKIVNSLLYENKTIKQVISGGKMYLGFNDDPVVGEIEVYDPADEEFFESIVSGDARIDEFIEAIEAGKIEFNRYRLLRRTYVRVVYLGTLTIVLLIILIALYRNGYITT
jgi:hypothetical protein